MNKLQKIHGGIPERLISPEWTRWLSIFPVPETCSNLRYKKQLFRKTFDDVLQDVLPKPFRQFKQNKDIYKLLSSSYQFYNHIQNIIKSNKQFLVDMKNYYFPNSY